MSQGVTLSEVEEKSGRPAGFFPQLYESVCKNLSADEFEILQKLKDDGEAFIRATHDIEYFRKALQIREFYPGKNGHESKIKREYGNKAYQEEKDLDALYLYTQAVISAPCEGSKDLSICLANRSAVLFSLKAYALALDDIKLAFEVGYPNDLKYKLLERKAKILMYYKQFSDAQVCYKELLQALDDAKLDINKKMKIQKETQRALDAFKKVKSVYNDPNVYIGVPVQGEVPKLGEKNPRYPAITNNIEIRFEPGRGRFAVATRDISVGDVVCVEQPCISHILPEYLSSNCGHCFKSMKAPMPCTTCSKVMYCSYKCRKIALSTYHPYECKMIDFLVASGMSIICFMAYKTIAQKPLQFFLENRDKFSNHDEMSGSKNSEVTKYLSDDYRNIYNLVTHHSERKMNDLFHRAMFSIMLVKCLKKTGYFGEEVKERADEDDQLSDDEIYICTLLSHFLEVYQFNTHEVAQYEMIAHNREEGSKSVFIGGAVYPTLAMFNHSCDPSIVRYYIEDTVIVQTIKNIKKGEEICENYGPIFFHSPKADRQDRLKKQYWFDCRCIPCTDDWPQMQEMDNSVLNFKCHMCSAGVPYNTSANTFSIKCVCGTQIPLLKALKGLGDTEALGEESKKALDAGNLAKAQELYIKYMIALDELLVPPYADYYKIQQYIWKCIWMRHGNRVIRGTVPKAATEAIAASVDEFDTVD